MFLSTFNCQYLLFEYVFNVKALNSMQEYRSKVYYCTICSFDLISQHPFSDDESKKSDTACADPQNQSDTDKSTSSQGEKSSQHTLSSPLLDSSIINFCISTGNFVNTKYYIKIKDFKSVLYDRIAQGKKVFQSSEDTVREHDKKRVLATVGTWQCLW